MDRQDRTIRFLPLVPLLLAAALYGRTAAFSFVTLDDPAYLAKHPVVSRGLTAGGAAAVLSGSGSFEGRLHPVTLLSHMAAVEIFGLEPAGHHLVNVLLHGANGALLYLVLLSLTGAPWRSLAAASLFVVHPLNVEAVAWVSERKGLLCALFLLLSLRDWAAWARSGRRGAYARSLAFFALSLLSKPSSIFLPLALLLLDAWPLRRLRPPSAAPAAGKEGATPFPAVSLRTALSEKVPFLLLSAAFAVLTLAAARGSVADAESFPLSLRLGNALLSVPRYLGKLLLPSGLSPIYPHPAEWPGGIPAALLAGAALLVAAVAFAAWRERSRRPHLAFGLSFFLVALLPVLGFFQAGFQAMADRYAYIPMWGILVALAWEGGDLVERRPALLRPVAAASVAAAALLAAASFVQSGHWRDGGTLFARVLAVEPGSATARSAVGNGLVIAGRPAEALPHLYEALRIRPLYPEAWFELGTALDPLGRKEEANAAFRRALELRPDPEAWSGVSAYNFGSVLLRLGRGAEAVGFLRRAVEQRPDDATAWNNYGNALFGQGRGEEALAAWREAVRVDPSYRIGWTNLAGGAAALGRAEESQAARAALLALGAPSPPGPTGGAPGR